MLYYKDFQTGKLKRTFGTPTGVTRGGPLGCEYLVVQNRCSTLLIPEYCLYGASQAHFNALKAKASPVDT